MGGNGRVQGDVRKGDDPAVVVTCLHTEALHGSLQDKVVWRRGPGEVRHHVEVEGRGPGGGELDLEMDELLLIALVEELLVEPRCQHGRDLPGDARLVLVIEPKLHGETKPRGKDDEALRQELLGLSVGRPRR